MPIHGPIGPNSSFATTEIDTETRAVGGLASLERLFQQHGPGIDTMMDHLGPRHVMALVLAANTPNVSAIAALLESAVQAGIANRQGQRLTEADWDRLRLGDLSWGRTQFPALTYKALSNALAFAEPSIVKAEVIERELGAALPHMPYFDFSGLVARTTIQALYVYPSHSSRIALPIPSGWRIGRDHNNVLRCSSLSEHPSTCLAIRESDGRIAVLTHAPGAKTARVCETRLYAPAGGRLRHSSNARFVLAINLGQEAQNLRLYDTQTERTYSASVRVNTRDRISLCDNGLVCLQGRDHYLKLDLPLSDSESRLTIQAERCDHSNGFAFLPSREGDLIIKGIQGQQGDRKLLIEGMGSGPISLEHPEGPSGMMPFRVTISPMRELAAVEYADDKLAVYSLAAARKARVRDANRATNTTEPVTAPIVFCQPSPKGVHDMCFGHRPDTLRLIRREVSRRDLYAVETTIMLSPPSSTEA